MDYVKLLFAAEARTLAMSIARNKAPADCSAEEQNEFIRQTFRKHLASAVGEIEYAARLIDEIKAEQTQ